VRADSIWDDSTVCRILANETYAGTWRYGKVIGESGNGGKRPQDETVTVQVPSIITHEQWEAAQAQRELNKIVDRRHNTRNQYLLRGRVHCGCTRLMTGTAKHKKSGTYIYYVCSYRRTHFSDLEERVCHQKIVSGRLLEFGVWEKYVVEVMTDKDKFLQGLLDAQEAMRKAQQPKRDQLALVLDYIKETEAEADEIALALRKAHGRVAESLQKQQDDINSRYADLCRKCDQLQEELSQNKLTDQEISDALQLREDILAGLQNPTFEDKRRVIERLNVQVTVEGDKVSVKGLIPMACSFSLHTPQHDPVCPSPPQRHR